MTDLNVMPLNQTLDIKVSYEIDGKQVVLDLPASEFTIVTQVDYQDYSFGSVCPVTTAVTNRTFTFGIVTKGYTITVTEPQTKKRWWKFGRDS